MANFNECLTEVFEEYRSIFFDLYGEPNATEQIEKFTKNIKDQLELHSNSGISTFNDSNNILTDGTIFLGDIHGQLEVLIETLYGMNIIDKEGNWIAKEGTELVQVGDLIDRGPHSTETIFFLRALQKLASSKNDRSEVTTLIGNHDLYLADIGEPCASKLNQKGFSLPYDPALLKEIISHDIKAGKFPVMYGKDIVTASHSEFSKKMKLMAINLVLGENHEKFETLKKSDQFQSIGISTEEWISYIDSAKFKSDQEIDERFTTAEIDMFMQNNNITYSDMAKKINANFMLYPQEKAFEFTTFGVTRGEVFEKANLLKEEALRNGTYKPEENYTIKAAMELYLNAGGILWRRKLSEDIKKDLKTNTPPPNQKRRQSGIFIAGENAIVRQPTHVYGHTQIKDPNMHPSQAMSRGKHIFADLGNGEAKRYGAVFYNNLTGRCSILHRGGDNNLEWLCNHVVADPDFDNVPEIIKQIKESVLLRTRSRSSSKEALFSSLELPPPPVGTETAPQSANTSEKSLPSYPPSPPTSTKGKPYSTSNSEKDCSNTKVAWSKKPSSGKHL